MVAEPVRAGSDWLALREPADAAARAADLVEALAGLLPSDEVTVVHDLGGGTGSMGRWLAPRLPGPQHWVLHDRDAELLELARARWSATCSDGSPATLETRQDDVSRLDGDDLAGASLVTASALLDMMTADELHGLVRGCAAVRRPVLVTLSVTGRVELDPVDPLDEPLRAAFNAHQRRDRGAGRLLGPYAADEGVAALTGLGFDVVTRPSPWRLGPERAPLTRAWFTGWVDAACEQVPGLRGEAGRYVERRLDQLDAGHLAATVHHVDLLALPR